MIPSVPDTLSIVNILQRGENSRPGNAAPSADGVTPAAAAAPAVDGRSARWEAHREERRRELIRAARRAIHKLGPDASMDDIAADAGTSKSVFYRYFGDKPGLRHAVGAVVIRAMRDRLAEAREGAREPRQGVTAMVAAYLHMAQTSPNVYFFATVPRDGESSEQGELSGFFDSVTAMLTEPLEQLLGDHNSPLLGYWPGAAIGLVRTAGEQWLRAPEDSAKPRADDMAGQIAAWLFDGVGQQLSTSHIFSSTANAEGK